MIEKKIVSIFSFFKHVIYPTVQRNNQRPRQEATQLRQGACHVEAACRGDPIRIGPITTRVSQLPNRSLQVANFLRRKHRAARNCQARKQELGG